MIFRVNVKNKNSVIQALSYENRNKYIIFPELILIDNFLAQSGSSTEKLYAAIGYITLGEMNEKRK